MPTDRPLGTGSTPLSDVNAMPLLFAVPADEFRPTPMLSTSVLPVTRPRVSLNLLQDRPN
jgi:hypothetical protein